MEAGEGLSGHSVKGGRQRDGRAPWLPSPARCPVSFSVGDRQCAKGSYAMRRSLVQLTGQTPAGNGGGETSTQPLRR
jgi:hypothetical protein